MQPRLYLDNAATSFPKPPEVHDAMRKYAEELGASAGRGAYREAVECGELVADCRRRLARLIGCTRPEQIVFTLNCTEALNLAIKGVLRQDDHVVATSMDHNSVLRPLHVLEKEGHISLTIVPADTHTGVIQAEQLAAAVNSRTRLVCIGHASNVSGTLQPIAAVTNTLRGRSTLLLVDAAQTAGHVPIDVESLGVDFLAVPGHKGLLGPLGTGALYIRHGLEESVRPLVQGGTGSTSESMMQPTFMPDRFESGSHNAIGLAGLRAALTWLERESVAALRSHELDLTRRFIELTHTVSGMTILGLTQPEKRTAVFSVRINGLDPQELSALLETEFGILTRSGLHCAPLAHQTFGTDLTGGTTRLSFGALNILDDVDRCADALTQLAGANLRVS